MAVGPVPVPRSADRFDTEKGAAVNEVVRYEVSDGIATITLDRPGDRNAVDLAVCDAMTAALREFEVDPLVRVAVLTGAGKVFCAGADLKAFAAGQGPEIAGHKYGFGGFVRFPRTKPVIAAVNGHALAGGLELVVASDLAVAATSALFGVPEVTVGLMAGGGGAVRLPVELPTKAALQLLLTGKPVSAGEALRLGLVGAVVEPENVLPTAYRWAEQIRAAAPLAVSATLRVARAAASGIGDEKAWRLNDEVMAEVFATDDAREGQRAFAEKRPPVWARR